MIASATAEPPALSAAVASGSPVEARKVAQDFEAVFLNELLESMFAGEPTDGPFSGGPSEGVYRSMMNDSIAKAIAKRGGIGIADSVYREILKLQEEAGHGNPPSTSPTHG